MEILDAKGDVLITDERVPPHYPTGMNGTSICDFYEFYQKNEWGIEHIRLPYSGNLSYYYDNGKNGYWIRNGQNPVDYVPELKRLERKKKLEQINERKFILV